MIAGHHARSTGNEKGIGSDARSLSRATLIAFTPPKKALLTKSYRASPHEMASVGSSTPRQERDEHEGRWCLMRL